MYPYPTHLDLFSGIGGFALAARWAGFQTVGFCEIEDYPRKVLKKNFPGVPIHKDIHELDGNDYAQVDLITGGYPCQPFSLAGKQKGEQDPRHLWPQMLRVIAQARPALVLAENVAGHISMGLDAVLADLENQGYAARALVVPACAVDAPHRRDRIWIVANADGQRRQQKSRCAYGDEGADERGAEEDDHILAGDGQGNGAEKIPAPLGDAPGAGRRSRGAGQALYRPRAQRRPARPGCGSRTGTGDRPDREQHNRAHWWLAEPELGRVVNGIPNRSHRLRALGNAIVPQVAYPILKAMHTLYIKE